MHVFLKNKPYQTLTLSSFLSSIGSVLFNIVFIIYAGSLPYKTLAVSLVSFATVVPTFFMMPMGYLADQSKKRINLMFRFKFVQFGLYLLLSLLIGLNQSIWIFAILLVINVASDIISSFTGSLVLPYFKHFVANADLNDATSFETGINNVINIVFQGVGASLIVLLHHNYSLFGIINALSFLLAGIVLIQQKQLFKQADQEEIAEDEAAVQTEVKQQSKENFFQSMKHSLKLFYEDKLIFSITILAVLVNTLGIGMDGLSNVLLVNTKSLWFGNFGNTVALISIVSSVAITAGALITHDGLQDVSIPVLVGIAMIWVTGFAINMFWWENRYLMIVLMAAASYPLGKVNPRLSAQFIAKIERKRLAATLSVLNTMSVIGGPVGQIVFLGIANAMTPKFSWLIFTACSLLVVVASFYTAAYQKKYQNAHPVIPDK
ncbi:MFS transporter [Lapidilactobacillus bayanensis]|uniref:MFS transporter n=1 Tax=Lapidilactobacillus bayanensis TaxID=2485998 RepID=UPI000F78D3B1|nr:MFS transporter [Lapidilactobacillus bayanensis]